MKKLFKRLRTNTLNTFQLPADELDSHSKITLLENKLLVEQHHGLIRYSTTEVLIQLLNKQLYLRGEELMIHLIHPQFIVLAGSFTELKMINKIIEQV